MIVYTADISTLILLDLKDVNHRQLKCTIVFNICMRLRSMKVQRKRV